MLFIFAVPVSEYIVAARSPPESAPTNRKFLRPGADRLENLHVVDMPVEIVLRANMLGKRVLNSRFGWRLWIIMERPCGVGNNRPDFFFRLYCAQILPKYIVYRNMRVGHLCLHCCHCRFVYFRADRLPVDSMTRAQRIDVRLHAVEL